jgi:hypothetical protein
MKATPKPAPVSTETARNSTTEPDESVATVAAMPAASTSEPAPIAVRGLRRWKASWASPPGPATASTAAPPARWLWVSNS